MCPLGTPVPLGNGITGLEVLGRGKGAEPGCVEKGPFGCGGAGASISGGTTVATPGLAVAVTVTVTWTVEVTV